MSDPLPDNLQKLNNPINKNTPKKRSKKFGKILRLIIVIGLLLFLVASILYWMNANNSKNSKNDENVDDSSNNIVDMFDDITDKLKDDDENHNENENNSDNDTTDGIIAKDVESRLNSEDEPDIIEINNDDFDKVAYMTGPNVLRNSDSTEFQYTLNIQESDIDNFKDGVQYKIERKNCKFDEVILSDSSFENMILQKIDNDVVFTIVIDNSFLDNGDQLVQSTYEINDVEGNVITKGKIQSPNCLKANDDNSYGSVKIPTPKVSTELLDGMHHFDYIFEYDEKAKINLEKGFTYEVFAAKCIGEGLNEDDYFFEGSFPAGEMHVIGFGVNIKTSSLPEDNNDLYTLSTYKINSLNGNELFSGFVDIPNCK